MSGPKPLEGEPLPDEAQTLRLPKPPPEFVPDNWRPSGKEFEPNTGDKKHAEDRGKPVRVSVWDESRTTRAQARSFRPAPTLILGLSVQDVSSVADVFKRELRIVYEPLDAPEDAQAGADGHAGIEGLDRAKAEEKKAWRAVLDELASRAALLEGPE
jgi:hypothetical protein